MPRLRTVILVTLACLALAWWLAHPRLPRPAAAGLPPACPLPPQTRPGEPPLQTDVPSELRLPALGQARLTALAGFSVVARVLGREDYRFGHEAEFSPTDLALGWGRMADPAMLARLTIRQGGRWYHYRWQGTPPIPPDEIVRSSANMHIIPADAGVAQALARVRPEQTIQVDGWLVRIDDANGWRWVRSLRRDDSGNGACELVYACRITVL